MKYVPDIKFVSKDDNDVGRSFGGGVGIKLLFVPSKIDRRLTGRIRPRSISFLFLKTDGPMFLTDRRLALSFYQFHLLSKMVSI